MIGVMEERQQWGERAKGAFGPILAGIVIDSVDFFTFGPLGMLLGLVLGGVSGFWMGRLARLSPSWCAGIGFLAGVYCMFPPTTLLPVATLIGGGVRFLAQSPRTRAGDPVEVDELPEAEATVRDASDETPSNE